MFYARIVEKIYIKRKKNASGRGYAPETQLKREYDGAGADSCKD